MEAEDSQTIERPLCKCHGLPMSKDGFYRGVQKWQCGVFERERQKLLYSDPEYAAKRKVQVREYWRNGGGREKALALYYERKAQGLCTKCGEPGLSESLCWSCLNNREEYVAVSL